jgi:tRNA acetyltransferase TAN1
MIKTVAENVEALKGGHSVDLKNPDRTIVIEVNKVCSLLLYLRSKLIYQNSLGVSVLEEYDTLKKVSFFTRVQGTS